MFRVHLESTISLPTENKRVEEFRAVDIRLLGIKISRIKDKNDKTNVQGAVPARLSLAGAPSYTWDRDKFGGWVEAASKETHPEAK
jgi:hypothetical protein